MRCRRTVNVRIGLDEASCPGRGASSAVHSALSAVSALCLSRIENDRAEKDYQACRGGGKVCMSPAPITLFLAAFLVHDRMITVARTESYTIAQTLEQPLLLQRLFPADWSTIVLSNNALNFPFTMEVSIPALRARPTAGPVNQVLWEAKQVWQNRLLLYVLVYHGHRLLQQQYEYITVYT